MGHGDFEAFGLEAVYERKSVANVGAVDVSIDGVEGFELLDFLGEGNGAYITSVPYFVDGGDVFD